MAYEETLRAARSAFLGGIDATRDATVPVGGRYLTRASVDAVLDTAAHGAVRDLPDHTLLAIFAERPALLDPDEGLRGGADGPRGLLRRTLAAALLVDLADDARAALVEGQDAGTLPEAASSAIAAMDALAANGVPYVLQCRVRDVVGAGDWEAVGTQALATHLAAFLADNGAHGASNDLRAALDARDALHPGNGLVA